MSFSNSGNYAPPGTYTQTKYENPTAALLDGLRLPIFIGTGSEILTQSNFELVRGSSNNIDQRIVQEDLAGRAVVSVSLSGQVTLGAFDGERTRVQVRKYPIVNGDGTGTPATKTAKVAVTVNGDPVVVLALDAAKGILELSVAPEVTDVVRVTYFFKRTDTLITDDLSEQVTAEAATLYGAIGESYSISAGDDDVLALTVDDATAVTVTIPDSGSGTWTAAQVAAFINAAAATTSLVASTAENNFGATVVLLTADRNILIGSGSANSVLGFTAGQATARNKVFVTFNGPLVDGTNGGVTTTDPADVTVKVDGVQVIPTSVDGTNRAVTLPFAPEAGATVTAQYHFNAWQDTFDYLAHIGVTEITEAGVSPGRSDYVDGVDFVLQNDPNDGTSRIVWGTASLITSGVHTAGSTYFGESQVSTTLVDTRGYLQPCAAVVDSTVAPAVESRTQFTLPLVPTTGNGRNSPLGSSLFQTVSNDRIDLPTNRPDLVVAYWGFGVQDALERGAVAVSKVDSSASTITLRNPVPVGADVFATFYYNTLVDQRWNLAVETPGASGVGTYSVTNEAGDVVLTPKFGVKSSGLATIALQFPSGSERKPDVRFETPLSTALYEGPVEEDVTVEFASVDSTLARFTIPGAGEYEVVFDASDRARFLVDGAALAGGAAGVDLAAPTGVASLGFAATMLGAEVGYEADTGYTTYAVDATNNGVNLTVDGVLISASAATGAAQTLAAFVTAVNTAAAAAAPRYSSAGRFLSGFVVTAGEYDEVVFHYTGATAGLSGNLTATIAAATYASAATLAAAVQAAMATQIATLGLAFAGLAVAVTADGDGRLVFALTNATGDASGYLEFVTNGTPAQDFCVAAGIDTAPATAGAQVKLVDGPIARRFTIAGDNTSSLLHDRLVLRSRLVPGYGTVHPAHVLSTAGITVQGSTGDSLTGLTATETALAGWRATVLSATLLGEVGFVGGQVPAATFGDARDGQPSVTFYAAGGTTAQNNVLKFTFDGVPVTVVFTSAAGAAIATGASADVPLGPAATANTVIAQIRAAMTAAGIASAATKCVQEGAAIRFISGLATSASSVFVGNGSANSVLGFTENDVVARSLVQPKTLSSALMGHAAATVAASLNSWSTPTATYFAAEALAWIERDAGGAQYLFLQSQGTSGLGTASSVAFAAATADDVLLPGTGLGVEAGDGSTGEAGISGYFVTSSDPANGSGTANDSVLNNGVGQDGLVGQTYRDLVTGLTFTVLDREGGSNYPSGESFTFRVRRAVATDSNLPANTIPGVELVVTNTLGIAAGDTAVVETFKRGGAEPAIGDLYYVTYNYAKSDFDTALYTRLSVVEATYGALSPDNPVTLASYLAILNGAVLVGVKQVRKDSADGQTASVEAYRNAVDDLEGPLNGGILPDILIPLRGDSAALFQYMTRHADIQSDMRHRAERTVLTGVSAGTQARTVGDIAQSVERSRFRILYPDIMYMPIPQADGPDEQVLVDGTFLAAMLAGSLVSPSTDVATPWTNRRLTGATRLARTLDAVEQNQVAVRGVTVIQDRGTVLQVRHGLTSDMVGRSTGGNATLSKLPTITLIMDEVQKQTRRTLERFIGIKFLPGILSQIEGQLSNTLKLLVDAQILSAYTGVRARVSVDDPTASEVEAWVQPVFPLLYIVVTFNLRSSL